MVVAGRLISAHYVNTLKSGIYASVGRDPLVVSEPGLYQLLARTNSPLAEPFQDWLYGELLSTEATVALEAIVQREGSRMVARQIKRCFNRPVDNPPLTSGRSRARLVLGRSAQTQGVYRGWTA